MKFAALLLTMDKSINYYNYGNHHVYNDRNLNVPFCFRSKTILLRRVEEMFDYFFLNASMSFKICATKASVTSFPFSTVASVASPQVPLGE